MLTIIVIGAGINGLVGALELRKRGHRVCLIDPGPLPHPLAASTDISKAVRSCYGADEIYTELAERAIRRWREWNEQFGQTLYHEVGVLFMRQAKMTPGDFEADTYQVLQRRGHAVERITSQDLRKRFPAWNAERFEDGLFDPEGGYAESGRVVRVLAARAQSIGIDLREGALFDRLDEGDNKVRGVVLADGTRLNADLVIAATGAWTPWLFPSTTAFLR